MKIFLGMSDFDSTIEEGKSDIFMLPAMLTIQPSTVETRLAELGWTIEEMHEIIRESIRARRGVTPNHPLGTAGYYAWSEASSMLRMLGAEKGFYITNENHIAGTYSSKHGAKFVVCNTDGGTGRENGMPQNRNKKGPGTEQDIAGNQERFAFYNELADLNQLHPSSRATTVWYLCIYCLDNEVRAELSCPMECKNGVFTAFYERLNLTGNGFGDEPIRALKNDPTDGDSGYEINVTRRQA